MFFDGWDDLVRLVVIGVLSYVGLVVILRATGKRTLSKMNAFDLVITVALGSTLSSAILSQDVSLSEGLLAFVLLCALQYGVTFLSVRSEAVQGFVKAEPSLLYFKGRYLDRHLKRERVTRAEILAAMRASGAGSLGDVEAVVLETDGSFSVVGTLGDDKGAMDTVEGMAAHSGA
ncbi:YetF domain-containing protein [Pelagibacterium nitratireducens]|uniref:YetF domain-containing protein n=1 Tax=Pelagibacterium nitratireducens TaxID=1046114 RepID=A0ABZ2I557_9HYPH